MPKLRHERIFAPFPPIPSETVAALTGEMVFSIVVRLSIEITVFAAICVLTGLAYWLAWNNRASDQVLSAVLPISIVAAIGVTSAVLIFGALPELREQFATVFIADADSILHSIPRSPDASSEEVRAALEAFQPKEHGLVDIPEEKLLFHHALQRQIVGAIARAYAKSWRTPTVEFDLPSQDISYVPDRLPGDPEPLNAGAMKKILAANLLNVVASEASLALPPSTSFTVTSPAKGTDAGKISVTNRFCTLTIETRHVNTSNELGIYGSILDATKTYDLMVYSVEVSASFSRLLPGHPEMPKYQRWAADMIATVKNGCDENVIWPKLRDRILFEKIVAPKADQTRGPHQ